ncbi:hypothetical protein F183_A02320 [Bryobacterales bacterium F-183]|nr:hypothetical protein F183_A02320 [Bryobacterales bacterium F-183]
MRRVLLLALFAIFLCNAQNIAIHGIYLHSESKLGVGGMVVLTYEAYVLLPDGTLTSDLSFYPKSESEVAKWRTSKPRTWGRWKQTGAELSIEWDDPKRKPSQWKKWFVAKPGDQGMTLTGAYRSMGGTGNSALGGNSTVAVWSTLDFASDGTVTTGGGAGSYTAGPGDTSVATSSQRTPQRVPYAIDGFRISLNGEAKWFYRYPDSDNAIGMGDATYSRRRR